MNMDTINILSIDVEEWFHILDANNVPGIDDWPQLSMRTEQNMEILLNVLEETETKATFFWLGWLAERFPRLVQLCRKQGHEIACHGYAHVLAYKVGPQGFYKDIFRAKSLLEDITGEPVHGFRAPGFGITNNAPWAFEVIKSAGFSYDSSVFPAHRGHGGMPKTPIGPYFIKTSQGMLPEIPMSMLETFGRRYSVFGGGYLRLAPQRMIKWGIKKLRANRQPLVVYMHPREIDPDQPRLALNPWRRFKYYVNLKTTLPKLRWLCDNYSFVTMNKAVAAFVKSFYYEKNKSIVVLDLQTEEFATRSITRQATLRSVTK